MGEGSRGIDKKTVYRSGSRSPAALEPLTVSEGAGPQHLDQLSQELTKQKLSGRATELKEDIAARKADYDVGFPDELRDRPAADDTSANQAYEFTRTASDWELARYRPPLV